MHLSLHELRRSPAYCSCIIVYQQGIMYDLAIFDSNFGSLFHAYRQFIAQYTLLLQHASLYMFCSSCNM